MVTERELRKLLHKVKVLKAREYEIALEAYLKILQKRAEYYQALAKLP